MRSRGPGAVRPRSLRNDLQTLALPVADPVQPLNGTTSLPETTFSGGGTGESRRIYERRSGCTSVGPVTQT